MHDKTVADLERSFGQLLHAAEAAIGQLKSDAGRPASLRGLTSTALSVGRVLGYLEAMAVVDAGAAASASDSAHQLLVRLERTATGL
jgi:hypothetical protein